MKVVLTLVFFLMLTDKSLHASESDNLSLSSLLDEVDNHLPLLKAEAEKVNQAQANLQIANSAFDVDFSARASKQQNGYPSNERYEYKLSSQIYGTGIIAGLAWDRLDGSVPSYREDELTGQDGRIKASLKIPLLKNLLTDQSRVNVSLGRINLQSAEQEYRLAKMKIYIDASQAYYEWIASIERRKVSQSLLTLAIQKKSFIKRRVQLGDSPEIDLIELENIILNREKSLLQNQLKELKSGNQLSLFLRNAEGLAVTPTIDRAESVKFEKKQGPEVSLADWKIDDFPLIKILNYKLDRNQLNLEYRDQARLPELDVFLEQSRYQGNLPSNRVDSRESLVGLSFTFPLFNLEARAQAKKVRSEINSQTQDLIFVRDQLRIRLENLIEELKTAQKVYNNSILQVENSNTLSQAARKKYDRGSEDLFLVNAREIDAANAQMSAIQSYFELENIKNEFLILQNKWIKQY